MRVLRAMLAQRNAKKTALGERIAAEEKSRAKEKGEALKDLSQHSIRAIKGGD